ncbi:ScbA/BarX family gamma-butyrolactone biosynthesis protein [Streptomyces glaucosporus]|uniref:ScbA/BarX family gamma-butyrolactone biosynthesis protein n=1 Tax=Streptomyces glaucosporus TaxID=284044 RepID=A0ABP5VR03_9ACTN
MLATKDRSAVSRPALTTTVAKEYVHRAALSEVFLTSWDRVGQDAFTVTAQWPRSHSFYSSEYGVHDPLLLCETLRQSGLLLTHTAYDTPFGYQLSWSRLQYAVNPQALRMESTPAEIEMHVTCSDIRYHRSLPVSMSMHIEAVRNGLLLSVASLRFGQHSPNVYQRIRAGRGDTARVFANAPAPTPPVPQDVVGRTHDRDIVLSPTQERWRWRLRVDTTHPVLFDHPVDHVPGMLLLESVRQAGHALEPSGGAMMPTSMDVSFNRYVEFDEPCWIEAEAEPRPESGARRSIRVNALQRGSFAFTATAEMTDMTGL